MPRVLCGLTMHKRPSVRLRLPIRDTEFCGRGCWELHWSPHSLRHRLWSSRCSLICGKCIRPVDATETNHQKLDSDLLAEKGVVVTTTPYLVCSTKSTVEVGCGVRSSLLPSPRTTETRDAVSSRTDASSGSAGNRRSRSVE